MKSKIQFSLLTAFAICGALTTTAVFVGNAVSTNQPRVGQASEVTHTLTLDKSNNSFGSGGWAHLDKGTEAVEGNRVWVCVENGAFTAGTDNFGTLPAGVQLAEAGDSPLYGMKSFTVKLVSGSIYAQFGLSGETAWTSINPLDMPAGTAKTFTLSGDPKFFTFKAKTDAVIDYISITYACSYEDAPTQESNDLLDLGVECEHLSSAIDLSVEPSTSVTNGSSRSLHIWSGSDATRAEAWPTVLIQLKTPVTITATGYFAVDGRFASCDNDWFSFKYYDSSWTSFKNPSTSKDIETGTNFAVGSWKTQTFQPGLAGTVAFIRIAIYEKASSSTITDLCIDNLRWVAA
jgi:hypothetical protein